MKIKRRFLRVTINKSVQKIRIGTPEHNISFEHLFGWVTVLSLQHGYKYWSKEFWAKGF